MAPLDVFNAGLSQTFNLKKKKQYQQSTVKQSAIKLGFPVLAITEHCAFIFVWFICLVSDSYTQW